MKSFRKQKNKKTFGKSYWIGDAKADYTVDDIYQAIADALKVKYKPFYVPRFVCSMFNVLDSLMSIFGRVNATVFAAGKFHKDIAGEISAATRDFGYDPDVGLEEIKKELPALLQ